MPLFLTQSSVANPRLISWTSLQNEIFPEQLSNKFMTTLKIGLRIVSQRQFRFQHIMRRCFFHYSLNNFRLRFRDISWCHCLISFRLFRQVNIHICTIRTNQLTDGVATRRPGQISPHDKIQSISSHIFWLESDRELDHRRLKSHQTLSDVWRCFPSHEWVRSSHKGGVW